jgi:signal transduction histidine kinase
MREEERLRLSREIHDDPGHKLTALKMDLLWMEQRLTQLQSSAINPVLDRVVGATEMADGIIQEVQGIAAQLRPGVLDKLGLPTALL